MCIEWDLSFKTPDGWTIFEIPSALIEYEVELDDGEPYVAISYIDITPARRRADEPLKWEERSRPERFCETSPQVWMQQLFLHISTQLENDEDFIERAVEEWMKWADEDEISSLYDPTRSQRLLACELL